jgi:hypothetical protein
VNIVQSFRQILRAAILCTALGNTFAAAPEQAAAAASTTSAAVGIAWTSPGPIWQIAIPLTTFIAAMAAILGIRSALLKTKWSLADALSEETQLSYYSRETATDDGKGNTTVEREIAKDKDGKPVLLTELRASTSRVIALMGMMVIVFLFVGFGVFAMYSFGATGALPDSMDTLIKFLAAGMTLFAPYVVNKFSSLFSGLSGGK